MLENKQIKDLSWEEKIELAKKFECWLGRYTQEVINKVLVKTEEIINNEFAMNLINELYVREEKEKKERINSINNLISDFETFKQFNIHNHCLTHSESYRDILYDMFIR